jgi:hypothetical protein
MTASTGWPAAPGGLRPLAFIDRDRPAAPGCPPGSALRLRAPLSTCVHDRSDIVNREKASRLTRMTPRRLRPVRSMIWTWPPIMNSCSGRGEGRSQRPEAKGLDAGESRRRSDTDLCSTRSCGADASDHFISGVCGLLCRVGAQPLGFRLGSHWEPCSFSASFIKEG